MVEENKILKIIGWILLIIGLYGLFFVAESFTAFIFYLLIVFSSITLCKLE